MGMYKSIENEHFQANPDFSEVISGCFIVVVYIIIGTIALGLISLLLDILACFFKVGIQ